jgi:Transposase
MRALTEPIANCEAPRTVAQSRWGRMLNPRVWLTTSRTCGVDCHAEVTTNPNQCRVDCHAEVTTNPNQCRVTVIGVDPHKSVHEACALTTTTQQRLRIPASPAGYRKLLQWGQSFLERTWAVEGAHGLGRHLVQFLLAHGEAVVDVPSFLSARVRELSRGGRRKTNAIDALATA